LIQLAKQLTGLNVVGTASRRETTDWVTSLGADHVINHHEPLQQQIEPIGVPINFIASLTHTGNYLTQYAQIIAPQGKIAVIDDPPAIDILPFKLKCVSWHWEFMFARSMFQTDDIVKQHELLAKVAEMVDAGKIKTTVAETFGKINANNLCKGHELLESGKSRGKIVLAGF
jgi:zinc-binding alcohol dehydrogenase family protein